MTGPTVASRPAGGAPPRARRPLHPFDVVVLVLVLVAVVPVARFMEQPAFVDRLTVVNPTLYDVDIDVTDGDRDGWLGVGIARRDTTSTFAEVIDQGDVWIFRFRAQAEDAGELRLSRRELEQQNWRFRIPDQIAATLAAKGAQPPP